MTPRLDALNALLPVFQKQKQLIFVNESPFTKDLCFKVCRHYHALEKVVSCLLRKPLKEKDQDLAVILYMGLVQIEFMDVKTHAAVNECVDLVSKVGKKSAKGLVNACLRNYLQDRENLARIFELPKYQAPEWLLSTIKAAYPEKWESILEQNQQHAPMFIRVSGDISDYQKRLDDCGIGAIETPLPKGLELTNPVPVEALPGFDQGDCSVQDLSPQFAAGLLSLEKGQKVLDACAAPGNKSVQLLETADIELDCLDIDSKRLERLESNLERCQKSAHIICASADELDSWWDGKPYDRILVDAPCSATGVIRRHPDIQILRTAEEVELLQQTQSSILKNLWKALKPGGILVYATCAILPVENDQIIDTFLTEQSDAKADTILLPFGEKTPYGWQILPGDGGADGFYYAKLLKV